MASILPELSDEDVIEACRDVLVCPSCNNSEDSLSRDGVTLSEREFEEIEKNCRRVVGPCRVCGGDTTILVPGDQ